MTNEYLFLSDEYREVIEAYKPKGITARTSDIENTPLWIASYTVVHRDDYHAKTLSESHAYIMRYSPTILTCESSEYYNKRLFPLVNEMERKLRKLLYLAASISGDKDADKIKNIEQLSFGELFELLFVSQDFILGMKKRINAAKGSEFDGKGMYSKAEIRLYLDGLEEHTLWNKILSDKAAQTLINRFRDAQSYRNDVMHARNIERESFRDAYRLFNKINEELSIEIDKIIVQAKEEPEKVKNDVNSSILDTLAAMDSEALRNALLTNSLSPHLLMALQGIYPPSVPPILEELIKTTSNPMQKALLEPYLLGETTLGMLRDAYIEAPPQHENLDK
jgi:hypothetical protein